MKLNIFLVLGLLLFAACSTQDTSQTTQDLNVVKEDSSIPPLVISLDAFSYGYSKEVINVKLGQKVVIDLTSTDGYHDFVVDELGVRTNKISTGEETQTSFIAGTRGTFEFYCSVGNHRAAGMVGTIVVE